jgi:hypothetical protein
MKFLIIRDPICLEPFLKILLSMVQDKNSRSNLSGEFIATQFETFLLPIPKTKVEKENQKRKK